VTALVRTIHVACKQLGLDDETRHDLQLRVVGKASLTEMTPAEQQKVLKELEALGWRKTSGKRQAAKRGDVRFAHVLWGKLCRAGAVEQKGAPGLNSFVRKRFEGAWGAAVLDVDQMRDSAQIATVIEALKAMCRRAGVDF
jgi:phage gp16-like protein